MHILVDENIPYAERAFGPFGTVRTISGRAITRSELLHTEALIVRSITPVNSSLLSGTPVRFVGTATAGSDHIALDDLQRLNIAFADAAGSNARAVAEYVTALLLEFHTAGMLPLQRTSIGVIGVGQVGGRVANMVRALGMQAYLYDPPREERDGEFRSASFDEVMNCDVVTLHVPLTRSGSHATCHMVDHNFFGRLKPGALLINMARGGVVDSEALSEAIDSGIVRGTGLDVWEGEPDLPKDLLRKCTFITPHVAGYSADAKLRGTGMIAHALARFLDMPFSTALDNILPYPAATLDIPASLSPLNAAHTAARTACDILRDNADLRGLLLTPPPERRRGFDALRKHYRERREFPAYALRVSNPEQQPLLAALGFSILT